MKSSADRQSVFRFKQFDVDQTGCAMKINTDGVLLGAMASGSFSDGAGTAPAILDIGTGTGVVALMLAQRFPQASMDAVEIDASAAARAGENFQVSPFAGRLTAFHIALQDFTPAPSHEKYDLIVSNPPFFVNALKSHDPRKQLARHTDRDFFDHLLSRSAGWLKPGGSLQLILPPALASEIEDRATGSYGFSLGDTTGIYSFSNDDRPIRVLFALHKAGKKPAPPPNASRFVIYAGQAVYSTAYRHLLKEFFLAF